MSFIDTVAPADATGAVRAMYARQQRRWGYVPNYAKVFCHRPELMRRWADLLAGIREHIEPLEFEVATLSTAHALRNSACSLAHGRALLRYLEPDAIAALASDPARAQVSEHLRAIALFARRAATNASAIDRADIDALRAAGLTDAQVFDVAVTVAARAFFATLLDALGVQPDAANLALDEKLRHALEVGRKIAGDPPEHVVEAPPGHGDDHRPSSARAG